MKSALAVCSLLLFSVSACSAASGDSQRSSGSGSNNTGSGSGAATGAGATGPLPGAGGSLQGIGGLDIDPSGGTGGTSDVMNGECDQVNFVSERKPVSVMLVLDRSRSMIENETTDGSLRWDAIVPALTTAITQTDASIHWGLKLYPDGTEDTPESAACTPQTVTSDIHVPIAPMNAAAVTERIASDYAWGHGTPTGSAVAAAAAYLSTLGDDTQKFILLATDGVPSCNGVPDQDSSSAQTYAVEQIRAAYANGFPTFVVAVLGGSPSEVERLNAMGIAGGKPPPGSANPLVDKFYLAESTDKLVAALQSITSQVASCVFPFDSPPPDPTNIAVKIDGTRIDEDSTNGWTYTSDQHLGVELHGAACQRVRDANQSAIDIIFGCPGRPIF